MAYFGLERRCHACRALSQMRNLPKLGVQARRKNDGCTLTGNYLRSCQEQTMGRQRIGEVGGFGSAVAGFGMGFSGQG